MITFLRESSVNAAAQTFQQKPSVDCTASKDDLAQISVTGTSIGSSSGDEGQNDLPELPLIQNKFKSVFSRKQSRRRHRLLPQLHSLKNEILIENQRTIEVTHVDEKINQSDFNLQGPQHGLQDFNMSFDSQHLYNLLEQQN